MNILKNSYILLIPALIFISSCSDDDPEIPNEEEVITTVIYTLTPDAEGDDVVFTFRDLDADGPDQPEITNGTLAANTSYTGSIQFLNELETPAEDITEEVEEEADEHQVIYLIDADLNMAGTVNDTDNNDHALGLATGMATGDASTGSLRIVLRHEPTKPNDGTLAGAGGETDVDVVFTVTIQ